MTSDTAPAHARLLEDFNAGKRTALARIISMVENQRPGFKDILSTLHPRLGRAHRIGITGPPGAGKSTLTAALVARFRERGETVGVIAVDPTSPFTGGALLGDRIRMNDVGMDPGVFIRSMATRGSLGGIALSTREIADVMDAYGLDRVIMETVGVGQSELDIARAADSAVVVLVPESGDGIQAMKAGLMEAADLFVINKSDRPGADRLAREIAMMIHLRMGDVLRNMPAHHGVNLNRAAARRITGPAAGRHRAEADAATADAQGGAWEVPVLQTVADTAQGVPELIEALDRHRASLADSGDIERRRRTRWAERVREEVEREMRRVVWEDLGGAALLEEKLDAIGAGETDPYKVAAEIIALVGLSADD